MLERVTVVIVIMFMLALSIWAGAARDEEVKARMAIAMDEVKYIFMDYCELNN